MYAIRDVTNKGPAIIQRIVSICYLLFGSRVSAPTLFF